MIGGGAGASLVVVVVSEIRLEYPSWAIETTTLNLSVGEGWDRFLKFATASGEGGKWEGFDPASRRVSGFSRPLRGINPSLRPAEKGTGRKFWW